MAFASREPMGEMNATPLIDVLLVLLIVLVMTVPVTTNSLEVPLPGEVPPLLPTKPHPIRNKVVLTEDGTIQWNGDAVSSGQLLTLLRQTTQLRVEPELQFEPEANASYDLSAKVLNVIKGSGVSKFGFAGNERYRTFARA